MIMIYLQSNERSMTKMQRIDVYRLMRASNSLADQRDYADYAQLAYDAGLRGEAKAVIDEGRASGKIPAGYAPANELYTMSKAGLAAEGSLAGIEAKARASATGALAAQTADAYLGTGEYAKAIELYRLALQKGVTKPDDVNLHLGIALARSGDTAGAKTTLASVTGGQSAEIASYWQFYVDRPAA